MQPWAPAAGWGGSAGRNRTNEVEPQFAFGEIDQSSACVGPQRWGQRRRCCCWNGLAANLNQVVDIGDMFAANGYPQHKSHSRKTMQTCLGQACATVIGGCNVAVKPVHAGGCPNQCIVSIRPRLGCKPLAQKPVWRLSHTKNSHAINWLVKLSQYLQWLTSYKTVTLITYLRCHVVVPKGGRQSVALGGIMLRNTVLLSAIGAATNFSGVIVFPSQRR